MQDVSEMIWMIFGNGVHQIIQNAKTSNGQFKEERTVKVKGDDVEAIYDALIAKSDKPKAIILDSIKGCGVKEVEETEFNHSMQPEPEVFDE